MSEASKNGFGFHIDPEALRPIIQAVVAEVLAQVDDGRAPAQKKAAYSEDEAAGMLGLEPHVLRDERQRGRITFSRVVGRRIRYTLEDLAEYLRRNAQELAPPLPRI